jgi:hypothetical protein
VTRSAYELGHLHRDARTDAWLAAHPPRKRKAWRDGPPLNLAQWLAKQRDTIIHLRDLRAAFWGHSRSWWMRRVKWGVLTPLERERANDWIAFYKSDLERWAREG